MKYFNAIRNLYNLNVNEIIISDNKNYEDYVIKTNEKQNVHSISKFVTALCVGLAIEQGYIKHGIDEPVLKYFYDIKIEDNRNYSILKQATIEHLITLTLGYDHRMLDSYEIEQLGERNLVSYVLNTPIVYKPGSYFLYSSAPFYLLSVIVSRATGMCLFDFAQKNLFSKLEISDVSWQKSKQGYDLGCTGLTISCKDLHKLGRLMINDGEDHNEMIVPEKWIKEMRSIQVHSPNYYDEKRVLPKYGYGFGLWICKNGTYFCDGTDGQYIIISPPKNIVVSIVSSQKEMPIITESIKDLFLT
ncbi:MAG: serine hydrolase [Ruminococcus sp.]|nr:serine hydrolase [Ruminococcus sp.]